MLIKQGEERRKLEEQAAARENQYKLERGQLLSANQQIASQLAELCKIRPTPPQKGCFGYGSRLIRKEKQREEDSNDFKRTQVVRIEEILSGDEVLTIDEIGNPCWDSVVLTDENLDAEENRVKMIEIVCQGFENYPLLLTDHHFIFILKESERCMIPAREVQIGDSLMICDDDTKTSIRKVVRVRELCANSPVKNIITAHTRTVIVNNILCSVHCEGDWGETYFKVGYFLWKYVSKASPIMMFKFHKWLKKLAK
jgi:hypothetical protein